METKRTREEVIEAIKGSGGIKCKIAASLGVARNTLDKYLERWSSAMEAYLDECAVVGDVAESNIIAAIKEGDLETSKWYARMKLNDRGYSERREISGKGGDPLSTEAHVVHAVEPTFVASVLAILEDRDGEQGED